MAVVSIGRRTHPFVNFLPAQITLVVLLKQGVAILAVCPRPSWIANSSGGRCAAFRGSILGGKVFFPPNPLYLISVPGIPLARSARPR
jgi:hypothetical protein